VQFFKLLVIFQFGWGICSFLAASALASETTDRLQNPASFPLLCQPEESLFIVAETSGFWVNICGGDLPHFYIGKSKINGKQIRLPLKDYDPQGNYFEAVNQTFSYLLIRGSTKGDFLTVTQGERELFRQPVLNWHEK
jgi:hypothetical protein